MELEKLDCELTVCKVPSLRELNLSADFFFIGKTDAEISLVCLTGDTPAGATARDDGWKGFRVREKLDFSLIGILSGISGLLAENRISIFAVSTYDTDYILVKAEDFDKAADVLAAGGYVVSGRAGSYATIPPEP